MMNDAIKKKVLARLRRIAGQGEGIAAPGKLVLRAHVETCVSDAMAAGKPVYRKPKIDELWEVFARYGCMGGRAAG